MATSKLDAVYRSILITKFFTKGWGKPENLKRLFEFRKVVSNRDECFKLIPKDYPVTITKDEKTSDCRILEGHFMTPLEKLLPGIVPQCAQEAHFQVVLPLEYRQPDYKPVCLHLAGTGDHFFWRRRNLIAKPLLKEAGIGAIILENPFYGKRKPVDQVRSSLHNVSDIFVMGGCLMLESLVLFHWCERNGLGPLGVTGLSMGGHMASLAATNWPKPLVLVPCLSWSTASAVFTQGVMSQSINWDLLESQYLSDGEYSDKLAKMVTIVDEAFLAGKKFAKKFSQTVDENGAKLRPVDPNNNTTNVAKVESINDITVKVQQNRSPDMKKDANLEKELQELLVSEKISQSLYDKLTMNEKFNLENEEIADLNKLCEEKGLKNLNSFAAKYSLMDIAKVSRNTSSNTNIESNVVEKPITETETLEKDQNKEEFVKYESTHNNESAVLAATLPDGTNKTTVVKEKSRNITEATLDILSNIPLLSRKSQSKKIDITKIHWRDHDALQFMRGVMDECTHLSNFSVPHDTSLIIAVCARLDAYVPRDDVGSLEDIWPGAEVRYVDAGHVSAYVLHQSLFRSCIVEAFERSRKKWKDGRHIE